MTKRVLVLGSTGKTGVEVVRALAERGATVRAATRNPDSAKFDAKVEVVAFDPDDASTYGPAMDEVDALYLVVPSYHPNEFVIGKAIVDAALAAGVQKFVKLSAQGVDQAPESAHRQGELYIEEHAPAWIHLRPTFFMENFLTFYADGIKNGVIALPAGEGKTPFIATSDIGDAAAEALLGDATGQAWTLTGDEPLTHRDVAATLTEKIGQRVEFVDLTPEAHIEGMKSFGMPEIGIETMSNLYSMVRQDWLAQPTKDLHKVLGRAPMKFEEWASQHAGAWS